MTPLRRHMNLRGKKRLLTTSVSLSSQRESNAVGADTNTATRRTASRVHGKVVRASALSATARVSLGVVVASHVRPLTERSLSKQDGTSGTQLRNDVSITGHAATQQSPATGRGLQVVLGTDVVLDGEGDSVKRAAVFALLALLIALCGNGKHIWVDLHDGAGFQLSQPAFYFINIGGTMA